MPKCVLHRGEHRHGRHCESGVGIATGYTVMNIRRLVLDVDKAISRPTILEIGEAIEKVSGVAGFNITVTEIDIETVGMDITIEGEQVDYEALVKAIEQTGAVVHSIDQLVAGTKVVERVKRER
jgi:uncharacterized protein